ncbi:MAG: GGDEF domain-containing protein, partial [Spirochaetales bacterium]|nr:GGDEF domain-containing protein [Spirochaetales bacterium]
MFLINGLAERDLDMNEYWTDICRNMDYAYQPIVNSYTGEVFAYEALLRDWDKCGFSCIFDVFDRAFQDRALYTVDLELRKKAITKIQALEGISRKALFYNLDNRILEMPDYKRGNTLELLNSLGINKSQFYFEISERHEFRSYTDSIEILNRYKEENFRLAIDDYGSGYSGLQLLYHTEPDVVKIDRFFIDGIHKDQKKKLFAENIVNMSHLMGIKVVAEGIETDQELNFCRDIGCDYLQGFRIARPEQDLSRLKTSYSLDTESYGRRRGEKSSRLIEEQLSRITPISMEDDAVSILRRFQKDTQTSIFPVVNRENEPQGVIREQDLKQYVYSPYGISLFKNHSHSRGLDSFIDRVPISEISSSISSILDISGLFNGEKGIIITENGKYRGLLAPSDLLKLIYEHKINYAREQNPLTGLPGNFSIHKKLSEISSSGRKSARVIFFDFNSFKPFNDNYGFRMGDRLIILFAEILKKSFRLNHDFIGHVGGDDFLVIQEDPQLDEECRVVKEVQSDFASGALPSYSRGARGKSCNEAKTR